MANERVDPLQHSVPIAKDDGSPTPYFQRQWTALLRATGLLGQLEEDQQTLEQRVAANEGAIDDISGREVIANAPLSGGGFLGGPGDIEIDHDESSVSPGTYGDATHVPQITVDGFGHITGVTNVPVSGGGSGGGSAWTLISTQVISGAVAQVAWTDLTPFKELLLNVVGLAASASGFRMIQFSSDNGSTWDTAQGNYFEIDGTGATSQPSPGGWYTPNSSSAAARTYALEITNFRGDQPTIAFDALRQRVWTHYAALPRDAMRVINRNGNLTAGTLSLFGR